MGKKKIKFWLALAVILGAMGYLIYSNTASTYVYYLKPSELISKAKKDNSVYNDRVRVGGLVVDSKIKGSNVSGHWQFYLTDERGDVKNKLVKISLKKAKQAQTIEINYTGVTPDTFKAGGIAIVEGTFNKAGKFKADTLVAKCPSKYVGKDRPKAEPKQKNI